MIININTCKSIAWFGWIIFAFSNFKHASSEKSFVVNGCIDAFSSDAGTVLHLYQNGITTRQAEC